MIKHASIIPLIGGETIGQMKAFGSRPDYLLSYTPFSNNDSYLVNYLKDVPYILLDQGGRHPHTVDVVNAVCPCAGLPKHVSRKDAHEMMKAVRHGMGVKESRVMSFADFIAEENKQGDEGTPELTAHRKKLTPGQNQPTKEILKDYNKG